MSSEDYTTMFNKQLSIIKDCKVLMNSLGENTAAHEIDDILAELHKINDEHQRALAALESLPSPETNIEQSAEELFKDALEKLPLEMFQTNSEADDSMELGNKSLMFSQVIGIPTDPITKLKIKIPARNKICNHIYEHNIIMTYVLRAKKKKKMVRCPHIGCTNASVQEDHIIKDDEMRRKIVAMVSTEEVDPNESIVDII